MNLKQIVTIAVMSVAGSHGALATESKLVHALGCTPEPDRALKCIDNLTNWISMYDGLIRVERGEQYGVGPYYEVISYYGDNKDGAVTKDEYINPIMKLEFPGGPTNNGNEIMSNTGYSITQTGYAIIHLWLEKETFDPFDITGDGIISQADDINKDNRITLEDYNLYLAGK